MNPNRDEILRELIVQTIRGILVSDPVLIKSLLKYDEDKDFSDPLSIPTVGYVEFLVNGGSGPVTGEFRRTFLIPAGTSATDGFLSLVGLTNEQGDQLIPDKPNSNVYDGSSGAVYRLDKTINGLETDEDGLTVRDVLVVLNGVEPVVQIGITNTTDRVINYSLNGGGFSSLNIGGFLDVNPSDTIIMQLASASANFYVLLNQNGDLQNTDGLYRIDETPHQWNIPSDTTSLQIISSL